MNSQSVSNSVSKIVSILAILLFVLCIALVSSTKCATFEPSSVARLRQVGNNLYVIDSSQNALFWGTKEEFESGQTRYINNRKESDTYIPFTALKDVAVLQSGEIFLIDGDTFGVFEYTADGTFASDHVRFENGNPIINIASLTCDYNDVVYALQISEGFKILAKDSESRSFSVVNSASEEELASLGVASSSDAIFACDFEGEIFYIATSGKLIKVTENGAESVCAYEGTALDISIDYLGNPYIALSDGKIMKYSSSATYLELNTETFCFSLQTGIITYVDSTSGIKTYTSDFVDNLSNFNHPLDFTTKENLTASAQIYEVIDDTELYTYPIKVSERQAITAGTKVIALSEVDGFDDYLYVLECKNTLNACYILKSQLQPLQASALNMQLRTFTTNTRLFKYPTADYVSGTESLYLTKIPAGTALNVTSDVCNFTDSQARDFYEVQYEGNIYYVMRAMLTTLATEEGAVTLKTNNATLKGQVETRVFAGLNSDVVVGTIPQGASFYVNTATYNKHATRTYVEYLDENNNYICGFVDTDLISLKEVSPFIIVGVFLVLLALILILILILHFAKEHKKTKTKCKEE